MAGTIEQQRAVSVPQAARMLGVHPDTLRPMITDGGLPFFMIGAAIRIPIDAIQRILSCDPSGIQTRPAEGIQTRII